MGLILVILNNLFVIGTYWLKKLLNYRFQCYPWFKYQTNCGYKHNETTHVVKTIIYELDVS